MQDSRIPCLPSPLFGSAQDGETFYFRSSTERAVSETLESTADMSQPRCQFSTAQRSCAAKMKSLAFGCGMRVKLESTASHYGGTSEFAVLAKKAHFTGRIERMHLFAASCKSLAATAKLQYMVHIAATVPVHTPCSAVHTYAESLLF